MERGDLGGGDRVGGWGGGVVGEMPLKSKDKLKYFSKSIFSRG